METIRPISDLRNKFTEISKQINENNDVIFFTKNGYGNMVVMSMEEYKRLSGENELISIMKEAEISAKKKQKRYSHDDIMKMLKQIVDE